ncbi:MAG: tetratricopeptide repeat protein [Elusimicrobia bacterium]|nr:tetratricopeptide repeat protein [Elusimicrobiota bacterium]
MARQWVKKELKRDPLVGFVTGAVKFVREKRQTALTIAASVLIVLVFSLFMFLAYRKNVLRSYNYLLRAESVLRSNPDLAVSLADRTVSEMKASRRFQAFAYMIRGDALYIKNDYAAAEKSYQKSLSGIDAEFKPNVEFSLAKAKEAQGKLRDAENLYKKFLENYDRHYLSPDAHLSLARILIAQNKTKEAAYHLDVVANRHQGTKWAEDAKKFRDRISK